jgi:acyl-CoA synthetase (AMP-forming)/AMP-acid ligase II
MSFRPVIEQIAAQFTARPRHAALVESGRVLSYAGIGRRVDGVAAALQSDGVQPGDAVALCATSTLEYVVAMLGVLRCGAVAVPLPTSATAEVLAGLLADCGAACVFVDAGIAALLAPRRAAIGRRWITLDDAPDGAPLSAWAAPGLPPQPVQLDAQAPFNIIYSSGTTGAPKGIVHPQGLRAAQVQRSAGLGYGADAVTLLATPLYSNITLTGLYPTLALGGTVVLMPRFDAAEYLELAQRWRVTQTVLVSVQYQRILAQAGFDACDLSAFRIKIVVGAPCSAALKAELLRRWPGGLVDLYGLTEGGGTCMLLAHEHPDKLHTVGKPAPGHDVRIIDDAGHELPAGETGEIVGHSPIMMTGYHRLPEATRAAEWHDAAGRRYLRTGDVGRFDADGFLVLMDRKKDMIISGGFNVYPSDIEAVLAAHADVAEASVVGVPSVRWGETPVAFVVLRAGAGCNAAGDATCGAAGLAAWVNARVGKTQRVSAVVLVESLPRGPVGKVLKRELRERYVAAAPLTPPPVP